MDKFAVWSQNPAQCFSLLSHLCSKLPSYRFVSLMQVARPAYWHAQARPPVDINKISVPFIALSEYSLSKSGTLELVMGHIDDDPMTSYQALVLARF